MFYYKITTPKTFIFLPKKWSIWKGMIATMREGGLQMLLVSV
jgi:hypothetical protein